MRLPMRRKGPPLDDHPFKDYDIQADIEPERLAAIGAITLAWNYLESGVDTAVGLSLQIVQPLWDDLTSRLYGFDAKIALIKEGLKFNFRAPEKHLATITVSLTAAEAHKKLRDGIIHALILDPSVPIAPTP